MWRLRDATCRSCDGVWEIGVTDWGLGLLRRSRYLVGTESTARADEYVRGEFQSQIKMYVYSNTLRWPTSNVCLWRESRQADARKPMLPAALRQNQIEMLATSYYYKASPHARGRDVWPEKGLSARPLFETGKTTQGPGTLKAVPKSRLQLNVSPFPDDKRHNAQSPVPTPPTTPQNPPPHPRHRYLRPGFPSPAHVPSPSPLARSSAPADAGSSETSSP